MNGHISAQDGQLTDDDLLLDTKTNTSLACPDFNAMRSERRDRTRATMQADTLSRQDKAAICIQSHYRGYLARKKYVELLFEQFNKEDERRAARTRRQVEEGELLIENHKLEVEFEENHCIRRNRLQRYTAHVITIQRAWRQFKRRKLKKVSHPGPARHHSNHRGGGGEEDEERDANGNRAGADGDWGVREGERQLGARPEAADYQSGSDNNWGPSDAGVESDNVNMTAAARRSKAHQAMLQDLGSSVELDDNSHFYESSPEVADKKKNRLSLAEEFAAAMEEDDGMSGEVADCEDCEDTDTNESDTESSSCATTPEWSSPDKAEQQDSELILEVPPLDIVSEDLRGRCTLDSEDIQPSTMQETGTAPDPNRNYSVVDSDPNANEVPMELTGDRNHQTNSQVRGQQPPPRISECQQDEALRSASSPIRTSGTHAVTHPKLQRCASAESRDSDPSRNGVPCGRPQIQTDLGCVEPTMPVLDWESLEKHLAKMEKEEEQQSYKQTQKNSRQAILRKLAMGTDDEAEGDIYGKGKDKLSARLQSGMNLQICFVNEPADGSSDLEEDSPRILAAEAEPEIEKSRKGALHVTSRFGRVAGAGRLGGGPGIRLSRESSNTSTSSAKTPSVTFQDAEDFETQQARLQDEARVALARAEPLARMQMELERQQRKKSPVTELAGVSGMTDICDRLHGKKLTQRALKNMSLSKLQFVVNDLHSQIESLNEELVQLLIRRDELQMEQDSKLIDIEDLTRWIRMNMQQNNNNNTIIGKQPLENGRKRQYETLLKLLGSTLPVSRKCFCGLSRSSSVVSSRSASSPEIQEMASSPLSPQTSICRSASSMSINESRASSPEMTWVRQAMIKYWYN
ncbi:uncharacterized protein LOC110981038 isoform X3 [Acanthaster planci]|uniref:Uncharacterized protein LOC110981038 isoform X3 n=1 Tax=Acanthaster planci TaxID=133434 RepID=A0A8B7YN64_ACAPL|nr:uncharacterized protein LOC110981038 isoform X3 [Acanthaster planci]